MKSIKTDRSIHGGFDEMQKRHLFLHLVLWVHVLFVLIFIKFTDVLMIGIAAGILIVFVWMCFSIRHAISLLIFYIAILPTYTWGSHYPFFHGLYFHEGVLILMAGLIGYLYLLHGPENPVSFRQNNTLNLLFGIFLVCCIIAALHGSFSNANFEIIGTEILYFGLYAFYFIFIRNYNIKHIHGLMILIVGISVVVSVEFIMLAISEGAVSSILINRVVTQQPHLAQIALPICVAYIIFPSRVHVKILSAISIVPLLGMIFFSQQRGLWVGVLFSVIVIGGFRYLFDQITIGRLIKYCLLVMLSFAILFGFFLLIDKLFFGSVFLTILSRLSTLSSLSTDASTNIRLGEIMRALDQWDNNVLTVIFGTGLGTSYESISIERAYPFSLDNAYAVVLWKMGLFGLIVFLMIYGSFYIRGFKIYLQSHNTQYKVIAASLMSGLAGLLVIALTNACIIRYRFIVIWVLIIAMIEIMYRDMLSSKTERHSHNK